jgi:hypothetical protein
MKIVQEPEGQKKVPVGHWEQHWPSAKIAKAAKAAKASIIFVKKEK